MNDIDSQWLQTVRTLINSPEYVCSPRGMGIREILGYTTTVDMSRPMLNLPSRKINYNFVFGEAHWILSGSNRVADIARFMRTIAQYSDNGITFRGAYGPKVVEQQDYVVESLIKDPDSRQALLTIWRENPRPSKDIPCTIALQFLIRGGKLHCNATMRSSDVWLGWVYDVFNFSMISFWMLLALKDAYPDLEMGHLRLTAGSQHIYERDVAKAKQCLSTEEALAQEDPSVKLNKHAFTYPNDLTHFLEHQALSPKEMLAEKPFNSLLFTSK